MRMRAVHTNASNYAGTLRMQVPSHCEERSDAAISMTVRTDQGIAASLRFGNGRCVVKPQSDRLVAGVMLRSVVGLLPPTSCSQIRVREPISS